MLTIQSLLQRLHELDVDPGEVSLTGREFRILVQRAEDVVTTDATDDDDQDQD